MHKIYLLLFFLALIGCKPEREDLENTLTDPPKPDFSIEMMPGDSNRFIITDLSEGNFQRFWNIPGGNPNNSTKVIDTIFYQKAGQYPITLSVSKQGGGGTSTSEKIVEVLIDGPLTCSPKLAALTGDCAPGGKCWTLSHVVGALKAGPTYDDYSWYSSPANGLQDAQYDDGFCFTFENLVFINKNNGASVNPWNGYQAEPYAPGISSFTFVEGSGTNNRDQIVLPDDQFIGVWDCDNVLDVVKLTADEIILRGRFRAQDGTPKAEGWFEMLLIPQ